MTNAEKGRTPLSQEQKDWQEQFNKHFGFKALSLLSSFMFGWIIVGAFLTIVTESYFLFLLSWIMGVLSLLVVLYWKPAWKLYRKILGDEGMPVDPKPHSSVVFSFKKAPLTAYLNLVWRYFLIGLVIYLIVKYFVKYGL